AEPSARFFLRGDCRMPISMSCPECGEGYNLADRQLGKKVRCKRCDYVFTVEDQPPPRTGLRAERGPAGPAPAPRRPAREEDDWDDRDVRRPRRPREREKSGGALGFVLVGLGVLLLAGGGVTIWLLNRGDDDKEEKKAEGPTEKEKIDDALRKLKSGTPEEKLGALETLAAATPDREHQGEVILAVAPFTRETNKQFRDVAEQAKQ